MAKGAVSKEAVAQKILEYFPGSFKYDKEIRIPCQEDGTEVQIKVTLTCAKTNVSGNEDEAEQPTATAINFEDINIDPTEDEKMAVVKLVESLGL